MALKAVQIEGAWIIETPDGRRIEPLRFGGVFHSRRIANAVIDYLEHPKPVAESIPEARLEPANAADNKVLRALAADRIRKTTESRMSLLKQIAANHGLGWSTETGFFEITP